MAKRNQETPGPKYREGERVEEAVRETSISLYTASGDRGRTQTTTSGPPVTNTNRLELGDNAHFRQLTLRK